MNGTPRVITILGVKGGAGKTILAVNLAAAFQQALKVKTALVEASSAGASDAERLLGSSYVHLVKGPFTRESLAERIAGLKSAYGLTLIDAGSELTALSAAAVEQSHLILLVAAPDLLSIQRTTSLLAELDAVKVPPRMVKVILNRAESRGNFPSSEVKASLPVDLIAEVPSDGRTASLSVNQGIPFVIGAPQTRISQAVKACAKWLFETPSAFIERSTPLDYSKVPAPEEPAQNGQPSFVDQMRTGRAAAAPLDSVIAMKLRIHKQLIDRLDLKRLDLTAIHDPAQARALRKRIESVVLDLLVSERGLPETAERERWVKEIIDEAIGLGPLEDLIADPEVNDILVNGPDLIYVEKHGKLHLTDKRFISDDQVRTVIERIIAPLSRRLDESNPMVDARLPDGSRVNAIIPPLSLKGPILSIRKFGRERYTMDDLLRLGTVNQAIVDFIRLSVLGRKNIIISGGTGSGKTTMLNIISAFIPEGERIITIEDAAELRLVQRHWVALEARPANIEGKGQVSIRQLFRNALRMRPDRIIIGECRGDETLDMLQAMNTGHDGSLTTLHANSPQDCVARLDSLVLMSNVELPIRAIREQIAAAIHLVVHTARLSDGSRKITHITEITGMTEQAEITFKDLFLFQRKGLGPNGEVLGEFRPTGEIPSFFEELRMKGIELDERLFTP
jgi:septum site-determining protein MinD